MQIHLVGLLSGVLLTSAGAAETCGPVKEYAQYKDAAKDDFSRHMMALDYCLFSTVEPLQSSAKEREVCRVEKQKILDALRAKNDERNARYALSSCK